MRTVVFLHAHTAHAQLAASAADSQAVIGRHTPEGTIYDMSSSHLRARTRQPGHDQSWRPSEAVTATAMKLLLGPRYLVETKPKDLRDFYGHHDGRALGLEPEAKITDLRTGRFMYVEVKRQGPSGNAEERAYRHHTSVFERELKQRTTMPYHAYVTVFCDDLASMTRYTSKYPYHIQTGWYLCWVSYDLGVMAGFLDEWRRRLDPGCDADLAGMAVSRFERVRSDVATADLASAEPGSDKNEQRA